MSRLHSWQPVGALVVASLLLAGAACGPSGPSGSGTTGTQAAGTVAAVASSAADLAGTAQTVVTEAVVPTGESLLTQAANVAPTVAAAATDLAPTLAAVGTQVAPTVAAAETTVATVVAGGPTPAPSGTQVDPCSLVTVAEASALAGEPAGTPIAGGQACLYYNPLVTTTGVAVYVLPASQLQDFLDQYLPVLRATGVTLDQTAVDQLSQDGAAGDMPAVVNDLQALSAGLPGFEATQVDDVGSAAYWSWHTIGQNPEAALFAANPGALAVLILRGTPATSEAVVKPQMVTIVKRILANLPDDFTLTSAP